MDFQTTNSVEEFKPNNTRKIFVLLIVVILLSGGFIAYQYLFPKEEPIIEEPEPVITENKLICDVNPESGKKNLCYCQQESQAKNKSVVVIKEGGIYDSASVIGKIGSYLESVKSDVKIEQAKQSILKFSGTTKEDLEKFLETAYDKYDASFVAIIGDNLPIFRKEPSYCPEGNCEGQTRDQTYLSVDGLGNFRTANEDGSKAFLCQEQIISLIMPPLEYSDNEKVEFVSNYLDRLTSFHNNPQGIYEKYGKFTLSITDDSLTVVIPGFLEDLRNNFPLPLIAFSNTDRQQIRQKLAEKPLVTGIYVHGNTTNMTFGIGDSGINVYSNEWLSFANENPDPVFFLFSHACQSDGVGQDGVKECCWPQMFLKTGTYGYANMIPHIYESNFIGDAYIKGAKGDNFIFGDQFLHFPK